MKQIKTALFPVAGAGTRFLPITKASPKEMLPILNKPLIQYSVDEAKAAGVEKFIFITGRSKTAIENYFDRDVNLERFLQEKNKKDIAEIIKKVSLDPGQVVYVRQHEPLGLGHAINCAAPWVEEEAFAVLLPDDFILTKDANASVLAQMCHAYDWEKCPAMAAVMTVDRHNVVDYGILDIDKTIKNEHIAKGLIEKPSVAQAPSCEAIVGRYVLPKRIFSKLKEACTGYGGEIQLTDAMKALIPDPGFHGFRFQGTRYDCAHHVSWLAANLAEGLNRPHTQKQIKTMITHFMKII